MDRPPSLQSLISNLPAKVAHFRIAQKTRPARERKRILIVEDQLFSRRLLQQMLYEKYHLDLAATAQEGLLLYLENAPDIVFLDIELRDESGHSLARIMRTLDPDAGIVMVTANNSVEDVALAKSNKVAGFIVKPYSKQKIMECLKAVESSEKTRRNQQ